MRYDGYQGILFVTWKLIEKENQATLKLRHTGLESFPSDQKDFGKEKFAEGGTQIITISLKEYLEKQRSASKEKSLLFNTTSNDFLKLEAWWNWF